VAAHEHRHDDGHGHAHGGRSSARALALVLGLTLLLAAVEAVGGVLTDSLALLADAGHMVSDASSAGLALFAVWLAGRPATPARSFGFKRAEILAALANGVALVVVAIWILVEAWRRLDDPPQVLGGWMLAVAVGGLAVNVAAAAVLLRSERASLNVQAALRHVVADLLGSVGVIVAALVVVTTGWDRADPLVSAAIALLVLASSWGVLRDSVSILLEAAPRGIDPRDVEQALVAAPGVSSVHDLHVWTITSGFPALSAHVLVGAGEDCHGRRRELEALLAERFGIDHTTLQVDHAQEELLHIRRR
jgi:cobalt-zinc-cadmium efflux system protein